MIKFLSSLLGLIAVLYSDIKALIIKQEKKEVREKINEAVNNKNVKYFVDVLNGRLRDKSDNK